MRPEGATRDLRVFFYVQHLLGIGHLHRAARLARGMAADGFRVQLVLGGAATPSLDVGTADVLQLPPVKAGPDGFGKLVHPDGRPFDAANERHRRDVLLAGFDRFAPDILVTEAFPFGRRPMRFELLPLLDRARSRRNPPLIATSVRDILQRDRRPERAAETTALVRRYYDRVLVHGDPAMTPLTASFPDATAFADAVAYTGIVAPNRPARVTIDEPLGAVVSVGGGAVGLALLKAAVAARPMTRIADRPWLVLTGPNLPDDETAALVTARHAEAVRFERFVPDLAGTLVGAAVSISQAGYNTVADILAADCRAVLVPFAAGGETEQTDRAALLQARGRAVVVREAELAPATLAAAIDRVLDLPIPALTFDLEGVSATSRILRAAMHARSDADQA